ncbi:DUF2235 domain-containing protein [Chryseobacterium sp. NRRL B-14859]|uniref:phospholipase effector Tle1 domain-containing protein n=1 Tax=unclassified Chryseobacterium TaxID=2593645 RepID=UPI000F45D64C|nr:DUF2235 domain-containing protein [Chryseobacterium sp. G0240]ROI06361.1 DUF2235 domain-containing protein [Chryseobacterium sp. G0240]
MSNVVFGNYTPPEEEDDGIQEVVIGVFFDGTLNNERNTYLRKEYQKKKAKQPYDKEAADAYPVFNYDADSYENDFSNVARMYHFYDNKNQNSIYVEGIGTENGARTDSTKGYTTGTGDTGVPAKVSAGCKSVAEKIKSFATRKKTVNLFLDVFGFSRGAAAARHFIHEVTKSKEGKSPARGELGKLLEAYTIKINKFQIRFVGLYDTVSSYGLDFNNDVGDLGLDSIRNSSVKNVVQLAAGHEWRTNFSLTNIESAGERGKEFILPGAHADVGGCYENEVFKQNHSPSVIPGRVINDQNEYNRLAESKKQVFVDQGWYQKDQLKIGPHSNKYVNHIFLQGERYIDKRYSYIPLHFMCQMAKEKKSEFNTSSLEFKFQIPQKAGQNGVHLLSYVKSRLQKYIDETKNLSTLERSRISYKKYLDFENEKKLINYYVHWSATGKLGHSPRSDGKRKIING